MAGRGALRARAPGPARGRGRHRQDGARAPLQRSRTRPARALGVCDGLRTPRPLGPFVDIAAATGGALREAVEAGAKPAGCFEALLSELEDDQPTIMVLEDLQWADEATLDVMTMLGRRVEGTGALDDRDVPRRRPAAAGDRRAGRRARRAPARAAEPVAWTPRGGSPSPTASTAPSCTASPRAIRSSSPRCSRAATARPRDGARRRAGPRRAPGDRGAARARRRGDRPPPSDVALLERLLDDELEHLDDCLASGMLLSEGRFVGFRHELARLAVEEAISPHTRVALHRRMLAALRDGPPTSRAGLPRRGGGRRRRGARVRAAGRRGRGVARRAPRGRRAVRARASPRGRARARRARRAARAPLARVPPDRRVRRRDRGHGGGAGLLPAARRSAPRGQRRCARCLGPCTASAAGSGGRRSSRARRSTCSSRWGRAPSWPAPTAC